MARSLAVSLLLGLMATAPLTASAEAIYSFVDRDGVIHVTNVPQDRRYRYRGRITTSAGVHRVAITGRPPPLLRRTTAYDEHILTAAQRYGIAVPLLKAVMAAESNFDPLAISEKGATGLKQLKPGTARGRSRS